MDKKKYDKEFKLGYDDREKKWMLGPFPTTILMAPALAVNVSHNINSLTITVVNKNNCQEYTNFAMGFDSIGYSESGKPVLYAKFTDAYHQMEKNMGNLEKFLHANIDIAVLMDQRPMILEFERRADGRSVGNSELAFD
jgi:hypothetical protein